jgi:twitching motility protein PilT
VSAAKPEPSDDDEPELIVEGFDPNAPIAKKQEPASDPNDESSIIVLDEEEEESIATATANESDDLMPELDKSEADAWKPSDAEWVESSETVVRTKDHQHAFDESAIDLDADTTVNDKPKPKIVVNEGANFARLGQRTPSLKSEGLPMGRVEPGRSGTPPVAVDDEIKLDDDAAAQPQSPQRRPNIFAEPAAGEGRARIPCDVTPMELHPVAVALLRKAVEIKASDVHLASGSPPFFRLHGDLVFTEMPPVEPTEARRMALGFMSDAQQQHWLRHHDLDFSFEHRELGRFRVNALEDFHGPAIIFRVIPSNVPTLEELGLPSDLAKFTQYHQGLVLITGPAGAGKTTTAAALINLVNKSRKDHIITVEDPIEFLHKSQGCNVTQRQVPIHTESFASALRAALREDPDVIMIGELRDLETMSLAIRAAETGHLVIGTLQTKSAPRTIDRVVDVFPADQQAQIRTMLSESLRGIISQQLIPRKDRKGRVVSLEVLFVNNAVSNLIRDSKTFQLHSQMQTGRKAGQRLMDDSLETLVTEGTITQEEAIKAADNPKRFQKGAASAAH